MERRLAAILAADVVGYTRLMGADEAGTLRRLTELRQRFLEPLITGSGGRIVKLMGDGLLVEFGSVVNAVACALAWQKGARHHQLAIEAGDQLTFRIGINLGDVIVQGDDLYGDGVNIAARLEALAEPGEVYLSGDAYRQARGKLEAEFKFLGEKTLKNVAEPVKVYRLVSSPPAASSQSKNRVPSAVKHPTIAVLPFVNMSGDPAQEYFSDGITEDIITELSRFRSLRVTARNSSFIYKGKAVKADEVGRELSAGYMVEGSVRKVGNRVRITAQLIETESGQHLWAERYDRELGDIFALQDDITRTIAGAIEPELKSVERQRSRTKPPENLTAWDWYQRGVWSMYQDSETANADALSQLHRAIELDPEFAPPYAVCASVICHDIIDGHKDVSDELLDESFKLAQRAVALDDKDAMAHSALGMINLLRRSHDDSIAELETAVDLNPSYADAYHSLGFSLVMSGRPEDAVSQFDMAIRLSPYDPRISSYFEMRAWALLVMGLDEEAAKSARTAVRRPNAQHWAYATLCAVFGHLGRLDEARAARDEMLRRKSNFSIGFVRKFVYYNKVSEHLERYIDGLRKAGVAE